jgi:hypothetical protein
MSDPVTAADTLMPGAAEYDMLTCPMPRCDGSVVMVWIVWQDIYGSFIRGDLNVQLGGEADWQVKCTLGHLLLEPRSDGEASHVFGECRCEPDADDRDKQWCSHNDWDHLREALTMHFVPVDGALTPEAYERITARRWTGERRSAD